MPTRIDVDAVRRQFPALARRVAGRPAVFFDGPAGSQVPESVIGAVGRCLAETNANLGGPFATSRESGEIVRRAHAAVADLLGAGDPDEVAFGPNMTTLTLSLSRALARTWQAGDEVVVSRLDHDANFTPWVLAARDAGAVVRYVEVRRDDCTLDLEDLQRKLSGRTRLVAIGCASNAVGTIQPIRDIVRRVHAVGAEVFLDAVHFAPHGLIDVAAWDCDYLSCSAYKFFGPHVGVLWGKRELLSSLPAYKVRPASDEIPDRWMSGTQNHEGIAGTLAAIDYIAGLGTPGLDRRSSLVAAFEAISLHERDLAAHLLRRLTELPRLKVWGITDLERLDERVPTVSFTHEQHTSSAVAGHLGERGIFVWHGNFYALPLTEALGLEPDGVVRVGLLHYNTAAEIDRLIDALGELDR